MIRTSQSWHMTNGWWIVGSTTHDFFHFCPHIIAPAQHLKINILGLNINSQPYNYWTQERKDKLQPSN